MRREVNVLTKIERKKKRQAGKVLFFGRQDELVVLAAERLERGPAYF